MTHPLIQPKYRESIFFMYMCTCLQDVIIQHSLPLVSFSANVKRTKQEIFSYIAKTSPKAKEYICYAFEVPKGQVARCIFANQIFKRIILYFIMFLADSGQAD